MVTSPNERVGNDSRQRNWLDRPTTWWQTAGVVAACVVIFALVVRAIGGYTDSDADLSMFAALMMSHGHWSCSYVAGSVRIPQSGPIYSLVAAFAQWVARLGYDNPFLSPQQMGPGCHLALANFAYWSDHSQVLDDVLPTALVAWCALALGGVAVLQRTRLRSTRWTWLVPIVFSVTPPVLMAVHESYHPQDLWAVAMFLFAVALWQQGRPLSSGVVMALAVMSQQFTLLGVVALLVVASSIDRRRMVVGGVLCVVPVAVVMYLTAGRLALRAIFIGTGDSIVHPGTWMSEIHVGATLGIILSRIVPLVVAGLIAKWCVSRCPGTATDPLVLLALLATCWSLRLFFEENLWGYYCMATGCTMILRDIVARRWSSLTALWLVLSFAAYGDIQFNRLPWSGWPTWFFQLLLAPSALVLTLRALRGAMSTSLEHDESVIAG